MKQMTDGLIDAIERLNAENAELREALGRMVFLIEMSWHPNSGITKEHGPEVKRAKALAGKA